MPQWAWVTMLFSIIVGLFAFLLRVRGGEPLDRDDTGSADTPGESHHSDHGAGGHS